MTVIEFPTDLDILITREFDAPVELVFDVFTKPEHVRHHFPPFGEEMKACEIDLRVGGEYRFVMETEDGTEMSFHGTYLEIDAPTRTVATWQFDGWPGVVAVETLELRESGGGTTLAWHMHFDDEAARAHMTKYDGIEANLDNVDRYLHSLRTNA